MSEAIEYEIQCCGIWTLISTEFPARCPKCGSRFEVRKPKEEEEPRDRCLSCQYEDKWQVEGRPMTKEEAAHWSMWGCTCSPEDEEEAIKYMSRMTR